MTSQGNGYMLPLACGCWRNLERPYADYSGGWHCSNHGWTVAA